MFHGQLMTLSTESIMWGGKQL